MGITEQERNKVKGEGFLSNKNGQHFSARVITENGVLDATKLRNLCDAAEKFGDGNIALTSRMTLELPGVAFDDIPAFQQFIAQEGMVTGGTGAKVRPVVACKGTYCNMGLIDTLGLATELHKRFYEAYIAVKLPHKFKIAVGGCPNNCVKPDLNDIGIVGQQSPIYSEALCKGCGKCGVMDICPMKAVSRNNFKIQIDHALCNNCGRCVNKCPFHAVEPSNAGYKVYIGGRWGKMVRHGTPIENIFSKEEVLDMVEKALLLFKSKGLPGERFGSLIDRLGITAAQTLLLSDELLIQKNTILAEEVGK